MKKLILSVPFLLFCFFLFSSFQWFLFSFLAGVLCLCFLPVWSLSRCLTQCQGRFVIMLDGGNEKSGGIARVTIRQPVKLPLDLLVWVVLHQPVNTLGIHTGGGQEFPQLLLLW